VNINLHLTDDTQLRAHGFVAHGGLFAEVQWDFHGPFPDSHGDGTLWGTPGPCASSPPSPSRPPSRPRRKPPGKPVALAPPPSRGAAWHDHHLSATTPAPARPTPATQRPPRRPPPTPPAPAAHAASTTHATRAAPA
jgi:hypothetical protein